MVRRIGVRYTSRLLLMRLKIVCLILLVIWLAGCGSEANTAVTITPPQSPTLIPEIGIVLATKVPPTVPVLQTTPTPLPSPTITPTATPIIHTVQAGETLLGIAIQHGTTTEEIQALNPEVNPRLLLVGQGIVLPQPTAVAQLTGGTAVPLQIEVAQIQAYEAPVGSVWLLGEVLNEGELPVDNVQVEVSLLDASGNMVDTAVGWVAGPIIMPAAASPFAILLSEPPPFEFQTVSIISGQTAVDLGSRYLDLAVVESEMESRQGATAVRGTVQNAGQETAVQPTLIVTFYNNQGEIIGFTQQVLAESLAAGASLDFEVSAALPGGTAVAVEFFLFGQTLAETTTP